VDEQVDEAEDVSAPARRHASPGLPARRTAGGEVNRPSGGQTQESKMTTNQTAQFPHQKLDAWHLSREARKLTFQLLDTLPTGFGDDNRQLRRSSGAVPKLIAEGANRWSAGDKRRRFEEAEGEIGETASGLEDLADLGAIDEQKAAESIALWARCRATVLGLLKRVPR